MLHKFFIVSLASLFILASCSGATKPEIPKVSPSNSMETKQNTITATGTVSAGVKTLAEKRKQSFLNRLPEQERKLFSDLDAAKFSKDAQKITALNTEIEKLQKLKKQQFEVAVKTDDLEKVATLRRELQLFNEVVRENMRRWTTTKVVQ